MTTPDTVLHTSTVAYDANSVNEGRGREVEDFSMIQQQTGRKDQIHTLALLLLSLHPSCYPVSTCGGGGNRGAWSCVGLA